MNTHMLLQVILAVEHPSTARRRTLVRARVDMLALNVSHQLCFASKSASVIAVISIASEALGAGSIRKTVNIPLN